MESQELLSKYFSGNLTDEENREVEEWSEASEENLKEFLQFKAAWKLSYTDRFDIEKAYSRIAPKLNKRETPVVEITSKDKPDLLKIAAAIAILIVSSLLVYGYFSGSFSGGEVIASGTINTQGKQIRLTDGSKLFLAESGSLTYKSDFKADDQRKVQLEGQAFFEISENKKKPFIILTNNAEIEVTGTSFLVKEYEGYTEVIVNSGSVKMKKSDGVSYIRLTKGEIGVASANSRGLTKRKNKDVNYLSWMTGNYNFTATPLAEVFDLLEEQYNVEIILRNDSIGNCRFTSDFENRTVEDIMAIISKSLNLKLEQNGKEFTVSGNGCN